MRPRRSAPLVVVPKGKLITLISCVGIAAVLGPVPAQAAAMGDPTLVQTIPFADGQGIATNIVTQKTYVETGMDNRIAVVDDRSGGVVHKRVGPCCGSAYLASDDRTATLYIAGTDAGIYSLDERSYMRKRLLNVVPTGVAVDEATDTVFATDQDSTDISVLNGRTGRLTGRIRNVAGSSPYLKVNSRTGRLYAVEYNTSDMAVIDIATHRLLARVPGPTGAVAVDARNDLVYAMANGTVLVIDGHTNRVLRHISLPPDDSPGDLAVDPGIGRLYVTAERSSGAYVLVVNLARHGVMKSIRVGMFASGISVDPTVHKVFVSTTYHISVLSG